MTTGGIRPSLVSIGVPTYNRVERLERSIKLMLAQDYEHVEVVVSDNASTDGTRQFCEDLARWEPRIRYRRQARNVGPVRNYEEVLRLATGEFYMHMADDDDLEPSYVSRCVAALEADQGLTAAVGRALMHVDGRFHHESILTNLLEASPSERLLSYYRTVTENAAFHGVARRSVMSALPAMRSVMGGDWLFVASLAFVGPIKTVEDTYIVKHMGGASVSMVNIARVLDLHPWRGRYGVENIILAAFCDIAWESPVYASLGPTRRLKLATDTASVLAERFGERWRSRAFVSMVLSDLLPARLKRKLVSVRSAVLSR